MAWRSSPRGRGTRVSGSWIAVTLALALGFLAGSVGAQPQPGKVFRIGYLLLAVPVSRLPDFPSHQAFVGALRQLGYEEGRNLVLDILSAEGQAERLPDLAAELVRHKPDVLVAGTCGPHLDALRQATRTIPIVVQACQDDLVASGIVASLAQPGGNVTGISKVTPEATAKRLQLLKEVVPSAARVAVLWDPIYTDWTNDWRELRAAARSLGVTLESVEYRGGNDLDRALSVIRAARVDAVLSFSDVVTFVHPRRVGEFALTSRLPLISPFREITAAGGLISFGPNIVELLRPFGDLHRQVPEGRETRGRAGRAADAVRGDRQREDGQGARAPDPAVGPGPGGRGDRVKTPG
jgi:putative ABC transport system substrate-binding protein